MDDPSAGGNRRGRETRQQLLVAGWELIDELSLGEIIRLVPARAIAERAGRTEGAFRHHFPTTESFLIAMLEQARPSGFFGADGVASINAVREVLAEFEPHEVVDVVREASGTDWDLTRRPEELTSARGELLVLTRLSTEPELMSLLAAKLFGNLIPPYAATYQACIDRIGAELLDEFTIEQFTIILSALDWGLLLYWLADPDLSTREFVVDALSVVALSLVSSADRPTRSISDVMASAVPFDADSPLLDLDERRRVAIAAHDLFADDAREVAFSEIAAAAGCAAVTVRRSFGHPGSVAAHAFAVHLDEIERAANANFGRDPDRPIVDGVCELVRAVRRDRQCARALLNERVGPQRLSMMAAVPICDVLRAVSPDTPEVELLVDVTLAVALADATRSPAEVALMVTESTDPDVSSDGR
jgi:AcrR family transcriptional regulator